MSSNGHVSKGGYDIYKYRSNEEENVVFINCTEFNSKENDLSIYFYSENYTLVNRLGNKRGGLISFHKLKAASTLSGKVIDYSGEPIPNAFIMINEGSAQGGYTTTDAKGLYVYKSAAVLQKYNLRVMAEGFQSKSIQGGSASTSISLEKIKPIEIIKEVEKIVTVPAYTPVSSSINNSSSVQTGSYDDAASSNSRLEVQTNQADRGLYYIIIGSTYNYSQAYDFWNKWVSTFDGVEILEYDKGLFRIGFYAGADEDQATRTYNTAREKKKDIWILRPSS